MHITQTENPPEILILILLLLFTLKFVAKKCKYNILSVCQNKNKILFLIHLIIRILIFKVTITNGDYKNETNKIELKHM